MLASDETIIGTKFRISYNFGQVSLLLLVSILITRGRFKSLKVIYWCKRYNNNKISRKHFFKDLQEYFKPFC